LSVSRRQILSAGEAERRHRGRDKVASVPVDRSELESLPTQELHDRAIRTAVRHLDVGFLWRLLETIPAAEAAAGHVDEAEVDVLRLSARLDDLIHAGERDVGEVLRPLYVDYLEERG
jgi:hypothetical protein